MRDVLTMDTVQGAEHITVATESDVIQHEVLVRCRRCHRTEVLGSALAMSHDQLDEAIGRAVLAHVHCGGKA